MATNVSSALTNSLTIPQRRLFLEYAKKFAENCATEIGTFRTLMEFRDRAYQMQLNQTAEQYKYLRQFMSGSAKRKITDISVPVVMPQIESAVAYQTGVYLTSYPIFGVIASPQAQSAASQFETVIANHSVRYGWSRELIKIFRDGYKYNFGAAFVHWKKSPLQSVVTSTAIDKAGLAAIETRNVGGNCISRLDPYNMFMDFRIDPSKYHEEGEAIGWNTLVARTAFKRFVATLDPQKTTNLREAYESSYQGSNADSSSTLGFYRPTINPYLNLGNLNQQGTNWWSWVNNHQTADQNRINYKDFYVITHFVCRAMPSDFGKSGNTPTIYYGIIVNWQHVIYVEEMIVANDYMPVLIMQPNEDGLGYQTQSMLDTTLPFQDMSSALWNISLESKRRLVFDRLIYNERFINKADIDPASAVARIPLRNASQFKGDDIGKAIYQIPYREDNSASNLQMSEMISQMADVASGQNKVDRGQFQKGNKTKTEFETTMGNSNSRQQLSSMTIEHQFMTPTKEIIKQNILLNQGVDKMMNRQDRVEVDIDPVAMRKSILEFKMTDGMLPADKMLNAELLTVFFQTAQAIPAVMGEYDVLGMFLYWAKIKGAYWLDDFKRNPEQQQQFLQQYTAFNQAEQPAPQQPPVGV